MAMIVWIKKPNALKLFGLLVLLAGCAEPPNYAPVKTVNQALEPSNDYYLRNKPPVDPAIEADNSQQTTDSFHKKQEIDDELNDPIENKEPRREPSKAVSTQPNPVDKANNAANSNQPKPTQQTVKQNEPNQKLTKTKTLDPKTKENQPAKPQKLAAANPSPNVSSIDNQKISGTYKNKAQKNQATTIKSLDNVQLTDKNNKKSIISIDNKKVLKLNFQWPLLGKITKNFSQTDHKGILIKGKSGQAVRASEAGKAVYCGNGLVGFGNLAIIKHNETYLTAYANNSKLFIKEGERVEKGQTIGQIGQTGLKKSSLHFEVRKNGKPINPITVLP